MRPRHSELLLMSLRTNLVSSGSQVPQRGMLERGMVGCIEYVVSHEKVLEDIILHMQECDRKAIPSSQLLNRR